MIIGVEKQTYNIILAGQSNAEGAFPVSSGIEAHLVGVIPNAKVWNGSAYVPLQVGTNRFPSGGSYYGPELQMMYRLGQYRKQAQYLTKYAVGGTSLHTDWAAGGAVYLAAIAEFIEAKTVLNMPYSAFVWIQGEADASTQVHADAYYDNMVAFIARVRLAIGHVPFVIVSLSSAQAPQYAYYSTIVATQEQLAEDLEDVYYIEQNNAVFDPFHYYGSGYNNIGDLNFNLIKTLR